MNLRRFSLILMTGLFSSNLMVAAVSAQTVEAETKKHAPAAFETVTFPSADELAITADLYVKHDDKNSPFIVLCHQAGWSRGEYREIAPKLNAMGFNCLAIDQRSGNKINKVDNETFKKATDAKKGTAFLDAEQDMIAALKWAKANHASGNVILWGSSYSSALALRIAGEHPDLVDGVMSFAPGEYFVRFGKEKDWVSKSAAKIKCPSFITSAKNEWNNWKGIYEAIPNKTKTKFLPETRGNHGSRALWAKFTDNDEYWKATTAFLGNFKPEPNDSKDTKGKSKDKPNTPESKPDK